jgi:hypothetical protein
MINIDALHLSVKDGVSPSQLHGTWLALFRRRTEAAKTAAAMFEQYQVAADGSVEANRLWNRYAAFQSEYRVLAAWTDLFHTAWVFATEGRRCRFVTSDTTTAKALVSTS